MLQCFIIQSEEEVFGDMLEFAINYRASGNPKSISSELGKKETDLKTSDYLKIHLVSVAVIYASGELL